MALEPLLDHGVTVGEGAGALLALPLVQAAAALGRAPGISDPQPRSPTRTSGSASPSNAGRAEGRGPGGGQPPASPSNAVHPEAFGVRGSPAPPARGRRTGETHPNKSPARITRTAPPPHDAPRPISSPFMGDARIAADQERVPARQGEGTTCPRARRAEPRPSRLGLRAVAFINFLSAAWVSLGQDDTAPQHREPLHPVTADGGFASGVFTIGDHHAPPQTGRVDPELRAQRTVPDAVRPSR